MPGWKRIDDGESFAKGDILISELEIEKVYDKTVDTFVNQSYQINEIKNHIPRGGNQTDMDLE